MHVKKILSIAGFMMMTCGFFMQAPAWVDFFYQEKVFNAFFILSSFVIFMGSIFYFPFKNSDETLRAKEMFFTTTFVWFIFSVVASLPFYISGLNLSLTDSVFEAVSGLTTTGATILPDLNKVSKGLLIWRSLIQWIGGMGIIVLAVMVLPTLRIGGMSFFMTESSERDEKNTPKVGQTMRIIVFGFCGLTLACMGALFLAGMDFFDAVNHALTCVSTAGFSTHNESIAYFESPLIDWILIFFMVLAALPLLFPFYLATKNFSHIKANEQIKTLFFCLFFSVVSLILWRWHAVGYDLSIIGQIITSTTFNTVSIITTTGYVTENYNEWGTFALVFLFFLMSVGGCTGSASGGIKMFRFSVLFKSLKAHLHGIIQPHGVFIPRYGDRPISWDVLISVFSFLSLFILVFVLSAIGLAFCGLDLITSLSGALSAIANVGPGLGNLIGPDKTFTILPTLAKWILIITMILGRLEFFAILVLFSPFFWRKTV